MWRCVLGCGVSILTQRLSCASHTVTLTHRPSMVPIASSSAKARNVPLPPPREPSTASSSSSDSEAERAKEDDEMIGRRLKDLEKENVTLKTKCDALFQENIRLKQARTAR